jgi:two-component system chemotaxis sensor kinase CheA
MEVKAEYLSIFGEEASDQLREWEECLLSLEKSPEDPEPLNSLFRAIHTLKGSAGFIGFDSLQKVAHDLESSLSDVRDGRRQFDGPLSELLFKGLDLCRTMIDAFTNGKTSNEDVEGFLAWLAGLEGSAVPPAPAAEGGISGGIRASEPVVHASPSGSFSATAAATPTTPGGILGGIPTPDAGAMTSMLKVKIQGQNREAYLRSCIIKARLDRLGTVLSMEPSPEVLRDSTEPFVYTVSIAAVPDAAALAAAISIDQVAVEPVAPIAETPKAEDAPMARSAREQLSQGSRPEEVVRVSVQKLDTLLNLVGELVIHNSGFIATTQLLKEEYGKAGFIYDLEEKTEALSAITRELQDGIMKARMLPIASVFNRFRRVVRDLAKSSGKSIVLDVYGEETEIDKKVIDRIGEPLVHLVRNAVDHGLEPRVERIASGKSAAGTIRLGAFQEGDHICIEISDDGKGLDRDAILTMALEKGLISSDEAPRASAEQILNFIFLPGFSTARTVTDISGRGVGMDAVKRAVDEMSGNLRVRSTPRVGTTVTISLPLTMAIITAVLVEVSGNTYAIPLSAVREIVKSDESILRTVGNNNVILLRNEVLALVNLDRALQKVSADGGMSPGATGGMSPGATGGMSPGATGGMSPGATGGMSPGATGERAAEARPVPGRPVVVVDFEGRKIGLEVEGILGTREVVIKSLSRHYREVEGLIGASILGNGRIALIVDVETLISQHHHAAGGARDDGRVGIVETALKMPPIMPPKMTPSVAGVAAGMPRGTVAAVQRQETDSREAQTGSAPSMQREPEPAEVQAAPSAPLHPIEELAKIVAGAKGRPLEDVHNQGAIQASISLSQLTRREIRVSFPESRLVAIKDDAAIMGGEEKTVGGIYVGVLGDLSAGMLLVVPEANLLMIDDLLHGRPSGTTTQTSEVDLSGISEMGNILASCFINAIADAARLTLSLEVPEISIDMCLPVIDSVLARFNQPGERILLTQAVIYGGGMENVVCHQVLFLEPDSLRRLLDALSAGATAPLAG